MTRRLALTFAIFLMGSTALAVTPVRAQSNDQLGRAIATGVGLFVLGRIIASQNEQNKSKATASNNSRPNANISDAARLANQDQRRLNQLGSWHAKRDPKVLPRECFFLAGYGENRVGVFGQSCLHERVEKPGNLPRECRITIPVRHGDPARVYSARCLREKGYTASWQEADRKKKRK